MAKPNPKTISLRDHFKFKPNWKGDELRDAIARAHELLSQALRLKALAFNSPRLDKPEDEKTDPLFAQVAQGHHFQLFWQDLWSPNTPDTPLNAAYLAACLGYIKRHRRRQRFAFRLKAALAVLRALRLPVSEVLEEYATPDAPARLRPSKLFEELLEEAQGWLTYQAQQRGQVAQEGTKAERDARKAKRQLAWAQKRRGSKAKFGNDAAGARKGNQVRLDGVVESALAKVQRAGQKNPTKAERKKPKGDAFPRDVYGAILVDAAGEEAHKRFIKRQRRQERKRLKKQQQKQHAAARAKQSAAFWQAKHNGS